jgi:hypothetical protein
VSIVQAELDGMPEPEPATAPEPSAAVVEPVTHATERTMLDALCRRYSQVSPGNGPRYVVAEHVRSHAGFEARRTADFVAIDTWVSSGFQIAGHEVKISRSDWLRELKDPEKAAEFTPYMHRWWIVVPSVAIVRAEELPDDWGLMTLTGDHIRVARQAPKRNPLPMPPSRMVAFLRAVQKTALTRSTT